MNEGAPKETPVTLFPEWKRPLACALLLALAAAPAAAQEAPPQDLSLSQAMEDAVRTQLSVRLAQVQGDAARARALESAADLLPQITGTASQQRIFKENLAAEGFNLLASHFSGFPLLLGPFDIFDARLHLAQKVLDMESFERWRSAESDQKVAGLETRLAAEQVAGAAALAYVEARRAQDAIGTAQADLDLARQLRTLSEDLHRAGAANGVDVARAKTREAESEYRLLEQKTASQDALIRLKRVAGLPLDQPLTLTDELPYQREAARDASWTVAEAEGARLEIQVAAARLDSQRSLWDAARFERLPSVLFEGDYGMSGNEYNVNDDATGTIGVFLSLPIFESGAVQARVRQARAQSDAAEAELSDMRSQVEEDVRLSLEALSSASDEVDAAATDVSLSQDELTLARGRFAAGVGDNIEVVTAEDALAQARYSELAARAGFNNARINLALALGVMQAFKL